uniref:Cyclin-like domain-containing protein n=1 Tax=Eucampia antarctica TaxID=49252 RepID=A0A7S2WJA6_9STRA|mmetsp:Transcript_3214/g.3066  ORF Transcript_3214/g.3066 Transcript_3214/m.3066 type:complete len:326 (+) Transcript_3214:60-1037(+)
MLSSEIILSDLPERFSVLRHQEDNLYRYPDYLSPKFQEEQWQQCTQKENTKSNIFTSELESSSSSSSGVNEVWREKICEWSYQVVDHFDFSRETVDVSISYLDRFLASRPVNKKVFQLAAMTCLYLAVKLYEPGMLRPSSLVELSRGFFTEDHVTAMEESILRALSWHLHPPTYLSFVREFLLLIQTSCCSSSEYRAIVENARFLTELGVCDYFFVTRKPSSVALACLLNAFESIRTINARETIYRRFTQDVRDVAGLDCFDDEVEDCRARLREIFVHGGYKKQEIVGMLDRFGNTSPVCVSDTNQQNGTKYQTDDEIQRTSLSS